MMQSTKLINNLLLINYKENAKNVLLYLNILILIKIIILNCYILNLKIKVYVYIL